MTQYCPHCGSQLEPGFDFCPNCGMPVPAEGDTTQEPYSEKTTQLAKGPQSQVSYDAVPMPTPVASPSRDSAYNVSGYAPNAQGSSRPRGNAKLIAAIGGLLAAAAVAAALVFNFVVLPKQQADVQAAQAAQAAQQQTSDQDSSAGTSQAQTDSGTDSSSDADAAAAKAASDAQAKAAAAQQQEEARAQAERSAAAAQAARDAQADSNFHSSLVSYYQQLSDYDSRIKSVASTFNNNYLTAGLGSRESYAATAASLLDDLSNTRDAVYALSMPANTSYSTQFGQVKDCYDYNVSRLSCIVEAWEIDTEYSDPSGHKDEILAPIARDNNSSGHNRYKAEFDSLYPSISL